MPENPEEGEARDVGVVVALLDGGAVRHDLPQVELLPVLDVHGLGGEGEAVGQEVALAMLAPEKRNTYCCNIQ